jgi:hypothetical protein
MGGWVGLRVGLRVGFININDMYNNDVGKGGAKGCEGYEVKERVALVRVPFYFINLLPTSLLYISILLPSLPPSLPPSPSLSLSLTDSRVMPSATSKRRIHSSAQTGSSVQLQ